MASGLGAPLETSHKASVIWVLKSDGEQAVRGLRRVLLIVVGLVILGYGGAIAYFYTIQRQGTFAGASFDGFQAAPSDPVPGAEAVTLKTPDGETIAGWYRAPTTDPAVVLFFHGNDGGLERATNRWRLIEERGAGVFAISYRVYPGSTGSPSEEGIALDARAAYDWLIQRHKASNIIIHGHSLGTGVATRLAAEVDAGGLILEAPFLSATTLAAELYPYLPVSLMMRDPFQSQERIGRIGMPVLIVHGSADRIIPISHGERLIERAQDPKTFVRVPNGTHVDLTERGLYPLIWKLVDGAS